VDPLSETEKSASIESTLSVTKQDSPQRICDEFTNLDKVK
jgi:hypothetical protein